MKIVKKIETKNDIENKIFSQIEDLGSSESSNISSGEYMNLTDERTGIEYVLFVEVSKRNMKPPINGESYSIVK